MRPRKYEIRWRKHLDTLLEESAKSIGKRMGTIVWMFVMTGLALLADVGARLQAALQWLPKLL